MTSSIMNTEQRRVAVSATRRARVFQRKRSLTAWSMWGSSRVLEFLIRRPADGAGILRRCWPWWRRARTLVRFARTVPYRLVHQPAFTAFVYRYRGIRRGGVWVC